MKNPLQSNFPDGELLGILDNMNVINKLVRNLLDHTDQWNLVDHKEWLIDTTDLISQQISIARAYCGELTPIDPVARPRRSSRKEAVQ